MVKLSGEMAMGEHTPEPWAVKNKAIDTVGRTHVYICGHHKNSGPVITTCLVTGQQLSQGQQDANAARIVACVNACRGVETGVLKETELGPELASARGRATIAESNESKATERADAAEALLWRIRSLYGAGADPEKWDENEVDLHDEIRTFLDARAAPAPVKPGDEGEG